MNGFFNPDNKIFAAIGHVGDYMVLSALWLICSIPIVTIGASTTALYYASLKLLAGEETYIIKDYFRSFKQNFKQATLLWLVFLAFGIFCYLDLNFYRQIDSTLGTIGFVVFLSITLIYAITLLYLFPYLSRFYCTFKQAIKSAFFLSVRHLGYTILMIAADICIIIAACYATFLLLFIPGITAFVNGLIFKRIFKRYMPEKEEETNTDDFRLINEIEEQDAADALAKAQNTGDNSSENMTAAAKDSDSLSEIAPSESASSEDVTENQ